MRRWWKSDFISKQLGAALDTIRYHRKELKRFRNGIGTAPLSYYEGYMIGRIEAAKNAVQAVVREIGTEGVRRLLKPDVEA